MKILAAIDGSEFSKAAVGAVIAQVQSKTSEVCVLHVVEIYLADFQGGLGAVKAFKDQRRMRLHAAKKLVGQFVKPLKNKGFKARGVVREGNPTESILHFAEKWKPDIIFVGSHGRRGWKRLMLGSVSEAVARHAACSVEIVRIPGKREKRRTRK